MSVGRTVAPVLFTGPLAGSSHTVWLVVIALALTSAVGALRLES